MTREQLETKQAQIRIELMDLESLEVWSDYEKDQYLKLKTEYFKILNQLESGVIE